MDEDLHRLGHHIGHTLLDLHGLGVDIGVRIFFGEERVVAYVLYGWIEVWFRRGMRESAEEIAELFERKGL